MVLECVVPASGPCVCVIMAHLAIAPKNSSPLILLLLPARFPLRNSPPSLLPGISSYHAKEAGSATAASTAGRLMVAARPLRRVWVAVGRRR